MPVVTSFRASSCLDLSLRRIETTDELDPMIAPFSSREIGELSISCQPSLKYLDVVMDARITWVPHIKYISDKATRATNVLRVIDRVSWGANLALLLTVYRNLVRAYLEWAAPLFRCASRSAL